VSFGKIFGHRNAMIRDQNAFAMFLVSALVRGMHPLNVRHIEYFQGANASHKRTGYRTMATALQRLRQNHRQNQEVGLL
jgi:hypothetical protein